MTDAERGPQASKASPGRLAALDVLRAVRERDAYAHDLIGSRIDSDPRLSSLDRAFARRLVLGVVSTQGTLDEVIDRAVDKPSHVQPEVRDALRLSTYEIVFLGKSPHAAVDQGVELVRFFRPRAAGFANAVLRKVVSLKDDFPFGDPNSDLEALARTFGFPPWLADKLVDQMGAARAVDFMRASNEPAPVFIAANACRGGDALAEAAFKKAGVRLVDATVAGRKVPGMRAIEDGKALLADDVKRLFSQGAILVTDASSQLIAAAVLPERPPASLLEVGAGRATKTILLQSAALRRYGKQVGAYVTLDNHEFKSKILQDRAVRYGVHVGEALTGDATDLDAVVGQRRFDVVFIDAPCSGLGTLRRHPEIRWRVSQRTIEEFAETQLAMLRSAAGHVTPGGLLAYSTCTVTNEENLNVVKAFLGSEEGSAFKLVPIAGDACIATRLSPGSPDAHFAVRFERKAGGGTAS